MKMHRWLLLSVMLINAGVHAAEPSMHEGIKAKPIANNGIIFSCDSNSLKHIQTGMTAYLTTLGIANELIVTKIDKTNGLLTFTLNTPTNDTNTLQLKYNPKYAIQDSTVLLPSKNGGMRSVVTVSKKEILLALLQHGRRTEFSGESCSVNALKEQVNVRQNIVAWSENLNWNWPDGESAEWNTKYWHRGTPLVHVALHQAFSDAFNNQTKYTIGCYTAAKIVMVHSVLDYYRRIKNDRYQLVKERLMADNEPLEYVEPGKMWSFEKDFDPKKLMQSGKILQIQYDIAPLNFVPGDWIYISNTDPISSQKTGYEGANTIYLGRNRFIDYYNDNHHAYTYQQKLNEVYQWRNGVFNRQRDAKKIEPLSKDDFIRLGKNPSAGGLVQDFRVFPINFSSLEY